MKITTSLKTTTIGLLLLSCLSAALAQNITAQYAVTITRTIQTGDQSNRALALDYRGYLYMAGPKNIYFQRPLYLTKYPTGQIVFNEKNNYTINDLPMDTLQLLGSMNSDSMLLRTRDDGIGLEPQKREFTMRRFEMGTSNWTILPEVKIINGLQCQHAFLYGQSAAGDKITYWDVWFCPEIPIQYGPVHILGLPGLVVEASSETALVNIKLLSYTLNANIPDTVFWPQEFVGATFKELPPYKKRATDGKKTKDDKRQEIINQ
jgi:GLPGLI family protein